MSYLMKYAVPRLASVQPGRRGVRVDERVVLNRPAFDGGAHVRTFVEDTSNRKLRRRRLVLERFHIGLAAEAELRALRELV